MTLGHANLQIVAKYRDLVQLINPDGEWDFVLRLYRGTSYRFCPALPHHYRVPAGSSRDLTPATHPLREGYGAELAGEASADARACAYCPPARPGLCGGWEERRWQRFPRRLP